MGKTRLLVAVGRTKQSGEEEKDRGARTLGSPADLTNRDPSAEIKRKGFRTTDGYGENRRTSATVLPTEGGFTSKGSPTPRQGTSSKSGGEWDISSVRAGERKHLGWGDNPTVVEGRRVNSDVARRRWDEAPASGCAWCAKNGGAEADFGPPVLGRVLPRRGTVANKVARSREAWSFIGRAEVPERRVSFGGVSFDKEGGCRRGQPPRKR